MAMDPENRIVRATTFKDTKSGLIGSGSSAVSSIALLGFDLSVIASGGTEVTYTCCDSGVPRYVRIGVNASFTSVSAAVGVFGSGGVEPGLYAAPAKSKRSIYVRLLPFFGWVFPLLIDIAIVTMVKCL